MDNVLFLTHRIPFPPNKGDKIRSYHLLKHLASRYRVYLGTFVDDPADWQYVDQVNALCAETFIAPLPPLRAKIKSLVGFAKREPLTLAYYRHAPLRAWVDSMLVKHRMHHALVFSSSMAQYLTGCPSVERVIDFVDVDSDKWRQYAQSKPWPLSAVYRREARLLLEYERRIAIDFDSATFVSRAEAALFKRLAPESATKISFFNNGVDADYFSPDLPHVNPYPSDIIPLVFTGAMDYWANAEAVHWFAHEVFPTIVARQPNTKFYIVGARPTPQVTALGERPGIIVTGSVPDVRPYLAHAALAIAPLRIARGIQNKVLEAMSMAKTVIASAEAAEGIEAVIGSELVVAQDARRYADLVLSHLQAQPRHAIGQAARRRIVKRYSWQSGMEQLEALVGTRPAHAEPSAHRASGIVQAGGGGA